MHEAAFHLLYESMNVANSASLCSLDGMKTNKYYTKERKHNKNVDKKKKYEKRKTIHAYRGEGRAYAAVERK